MHKWIQHLVLGGAKVDALPGHSNSKNNYRIGWGQQAFACTQNKSPEDC